MVKPHIIKAQFVKELESCGLFDAKVALAIEIAEDVHRNAIRDDGLPYLEQHIYPVTLSSIEYLIKKGRTVSTTIVVTALLHDILEDTDKYTVDYISDNFGTDVVRNLHYLCKPKKYADESLRTQRVKHEEHRAFVKQLKNATFEVKVLKCLDRLNNLKCTEAFRRPEQYKRFIKDTIRYYIPFSEGIDPVLALEMGTEVDRITTKKG